MLILTLLAWLPTWALIAIFCFVVVSAVVLVDRGMGEHG